MKKGSIFIGLLAFLFSCVSVLEKPSSAEIGIEAAEKETEKMPDSPGKTIIRTGLKQAKTELEDQKNINKGLNKENRQNQKIAIEKSEDAGRWYGIEDLLFYIIGFFAMLFVGFGLYVGFRIAVKRGMI